jgi:tetratricopeptide (TPR) repeat protein
VRFVAERGTGAGRRGRRWAAGAGAVIALVLLSVAGAYWWYHTSRPGYRLHTGQEALHAGDYDRASDIASALESDGYADQAHLLRGESFLRRQRLAEAAREFNQIDQADTDVMVDASLIYGVGFLSLKMYAEAERLLRYVVAKRPDEVEAHRALASIYYDQRALNQATEYARRWADLDPTNGQPYRFLGLIYKEREDANFQAVEAYRDGLVRELSPSVREQVKIELAEVLIRQTEYAEALKLLEDAHPTDAEHKRSALEERAECLYALGRTAELPAFLDGALRDYPTSVPLLRVRAQVHQAAGENQAAADLLEKALQIDPTDYPSRYALAGAYQGLGRAADAAAQRRQVEETQKAMKEVTALVQQANDRPTDRAVRLQLAALCEKLKRPDLAAIWLQAAARVPEKTERGAEKPSLR